MIEQKDTSNLFFRDSLKLSSLSAITLGAALISFIFVGLMTVMVASPFFGWSNESMTAAVSLDNSNEFASYRTYVTFKMTEKPSKEIKEKSIEKTKEEILVSQNEIISKLESSKSQQSKTSIQEKNDEVSEVKNVQENQFSLKEESQGDRSPPVYPQRALQRNIEGYVLVEFTIKEDGSVGDVLILESEPKNIFDKSVLNAVKQFIYSPRIVNGVAVAVPGVQRRFEFKLEV